jgi:hypothetical protein
MKIGPQYPEADATPYASVASPHRIKMHLDLDSRVLSFSADSVHLGIAFKIPARMKSVFPVVSLADGGLSVVIVTARQIQPKPSYLEQKLSTFSPIVLLFDSQKKAEPVEIGNKGLTASVKFVQPIESFLTLVAGQQQMSGFLFEETSGSLLVCI